MTDGASPVLELVGVSKRFPGVLANDRVSFALGRGEVFGLLGENGAGKSTLMNIVSGLVEPDGGEIRIDGGAVSLASPRDAIAAGIGMVHQHFMLVPTLTVAENVMLGDHRLPRGRRAVAWVAARVRQLGEEIGLPVSPDAVVAALDVGGRQRAEIVKALYREARILILDEPTAVLSGPESQGLFETIRALAAKGTSIILISHKLDDIHAVCDRVVVMRRGGVVDDAALGERTREQLVRAMVGDDLPPRAPAGEADRGKVLMAARDLTVRRDDGTTAVEYADFRLYAGEILGLAGVEGNGQRELVEALAGLRKPVAGRVVFTEIGRRRSSPRALRRYGVRHVPEDRGQGGIAQGLGLTDNYLLSHFFQGPFSRLGWLRHGRAADRVARAIDDFDIRAPHPETPIEALSGGNQQKLVLARELALGPRVLIAAHPTRGLDVRTVGFIQDRLMAQRADGVATLLVSSDLAEIWDMADRVMVMTRGRLRGPVPINETTVQQVGAWMAGQ